MKQHEFHDLLAKHAHFDVQLRSHLLEDIKDAASPIEPSYTRVKPAWNLLKTVSAFAIVLVFGLTAFLYFDPVESLMMEVNPAIEIQINHFGIVIHTSADNPDGEALLQELNLNHKNWQDAINLFLDKAITLGYVDAFDETMLLRVIGNSYESENVFEAKVSQYLTEIDVQSIILTQHTSQADYLYSFLVRSEKTEAAGEYVTTTTAMQWNDGVDSAADIPQNDYSYAYLIGMSADSFAELAETLQVSEAKLEVMIIILLNNSTYQHVGGLNELALLSVGELYTLYYQIGS